MQLTPLTGTMTAIWSGVRSPALLMQLTPLTGTMTQGYTVDRVREVQMQLTPLTGTMTKLEFVLPAEWDGMQLTPLTGTMTMQMMATKALRRDAAYTPHGDDDGSTHRMKFPHDLRCSLHPSRGR